MRWGAPLAINSVADWRLWLQQNAGSEREVFLLVVKDKSKADGIRYGEAVEEALCFGWIDGIARRFDDDYSLNRFTPRRPGSNWSQSNRERIVRLGREGRIHPAGLACVPEEVRRAIES